MVVVEAAATNEDEVATDTARITMKMANGDHLATFPPMGDAADGGGDDGGAGGGVM